ncbi:hypothetical protein HERIO_1460 [Hepatospora eriocheir]|uniref:Uncharacterized protein n=1 Tax=Hepatospora eriocheir TaxID=1081669 RepID=A0A1X0QA95_9MICR|nr:hypothetical protein HERIO_1460 [Hepatospora eriocheir]
MFLTCEVCGEQMNQIDDLLVCENGHTITSTLIVNDHTQKSLGKKQVVKKVKAKKVLTVRNKDKTPEQLEKEKNIRYKTSLMLINDIFDELIKKKVIKSKIIFKYFTGFFENASPPIFMNVSEIRKTSLNDDFYLRSKKFSNCDTLNIPTFFGISDLYTILYLQMRHEREKEGRVLLFTEFFTFINSLLFLDVFKKFTKKHRLKSGNQIINWGIEKFKAIVIIEEKLKFYGNYDNSKPYYDCSYIKAESGVISIKIQRIKFLIRSTINYSTEMAKTYVDCFIKEFNIEEVVEKKQLYFYLYKLVYTRDSNLIFVPEIEYLVFIYLYLHSFHREHIERVKGNFESLYKINDFNEFVSKRIGLYNATTDPQEYINFINKALI